LIVIDQNKEKIDDERMYSFDLPYVIDPHYLSEMYYDEYVKSTESWWPWKAQPGNKTLPPRDHDLKDWKGWSKRGYNFPEVTRRDSHVDPLILDIVDYFGWTNTAVWWNYTSDWFDYPVHTDSNHFVNKQCDENSPRENAPLQMVPKERLIYLNLGLDYNEIKREGCKFSINIVCSQEFNGDPKPQPMMFTKENQLELMNDGKIESTMDYYKSEDDFAYYYKSALINTTWTHYVEGDRQHDRLLWRLSIYGSEHNFDDAKEKLKSMGL